MLKAELQFYNHFIISHLLPCGDEGDQQEQDDPYLRIEEPRDEGPVDTHGV